MKFWKQLKCSHEFNFHGWSYVKCNKCGFVKTDEALNAKLQKDRWESLFKEVSDHPEINREAINNEISKRGRLTSHQI